jgi:tRNA/tmRNA/rRNA uracil-C5-methylase (TrmA/RlmC/RlmD family)
MLLKFLGDGLAIAAAPRNNWVVVVPLCLPGEKIRGRVYRHSRLHSVADLVSIETPNNDLRDSSRVKCKYFGQCAGCQYQMLSYETQLDLKRTVVVKAYRNFSGTNLVSPRPFNCLSRCRYTGFIDAAYTRDCCIALTIWLPHKNHSTLRRSSEKISEERAAL